MTSRSADASSSAFATSIVSGPRRRLVGRAGGAGIGRTKVLCGADVSVLLVGFFATGRGGAGMLGGRSGRRGFDSIGGGNVLAIRGPLWRTFVMSRAVRLSIGTP